MVWTDDEVVEEWVTNGKGKGKTGDKGANQGKSSETSKNDKINNKKKDTDKKDKSTNDTASKGGKLINKVVNKTIIKRPATNTK